MCKAPAHWWFAKLRIHHSHDVSSIQLLPDPLPMLCSIQFPNIFVRRVLKFTWRNRRTCVPPSCFIPQMSTTSASHLAKAWSQELNLGLLYQWQEPNCWNPHLLPPKVHDNRSWDREQSQGCTQALCVGYKNPNDQLNPYHKHLPPCRILLWVAIIEQFILLNQQKCLYWLCCSWLTRLGDIEGLQKRLNTGKENEISGCFFFHVTWHYLKVTKNDFMA